MDVLEARGRRFDARKVRQSERGVNGGKSERVGSVVQLDLPWHAKILYLARTDSAPHLRTSMLSMPLPSDYPRVWTLLNRQKELYDSALRLHR